MKYLPGLLLLLLIFVAPSLAQTSDVSAKKRLFVFHVGSLSGMGLGGSVALTPTVSLEATVGLPSFVTVGVGQPFTGNQVNATVAVQVRHPSGIYLAPGVHAGYYRMKATDKYNLRPFAEETETMFLARPNVAVGVEVIRSPRRFNFEIGVAFLLPERITRDIQRGSRTWLFEAERSIDGPLFPFYTFRMKV